MESTGVKTDTDRICEIALILQDYDSSVERLSYVRRINPEKSISPGAFGVHGIANADVIGMPTFIQVAPMVSVILTKVDVLVGHNLEGFDLVMLINEFARVGVPLNARPVIFDTMLMGRSATPDGKVPTLGELCWAFDVTYKPEEAHAAKYDVERTLDCFRRGVQLGVFKLPETKA